MAILSHFFALFEANFENENFSKNNFSRPLFSAFGKILRQTIGGAPGVILRHYLTIYLKTSYEKFMRQIGKRIKQHPVFSHLRQKTYKKLKNTAKWGPEDPICVER